MTFCLVFIKILKTNKLCEQIICKKNDGLIFMINMFKLSTM